MSRVKNDADKSGGVIYVKKKLSKKAKKRMKCCAIAIFVLIIGMIIFIFTVLPVIFMNSIDLQSAVMFTSFGVSKEKSYFKSHKLIIGLRNLYIPIKDKGTNRTLSLGAWHIVPKVLHDLVLTSEVFDYDYVLEHSNLSVLLYFHGTGEDRSSSAAKYKILRALFHVIAFDYRSYADSTSAMLTEDLVVNDCLQIYDWLVNKTSAPIFFWGHSLGSAIATKTAALLKNRKDRPVGIILEAAFTKMSEELYVHPYGKIFSWLPWFELTIVKPLEKNGFVFDNTKNILDIDYPIMILTSTDDTVVPYKFGFQLYEIARNRTTINTTLYYQFPYTLGYDHNFLYEDPFLPYFFNYFVYVCTELKSMKVMISTHES